jgi:hypothetical protein
MLESKDDWQINDPSGALDLTFARGNRGKWVANVKSSPIALPEKQPDFHLIKGSNA